MNWIVFHLGRIGFRYAKRSKEGIRIADEGPDRYV